MHPSESHTSARVRIGAWCYVALSISTAADATSDSGETAALLSLYNATSGAAWSCGGTLPLDDRCNITANIATSREEAQESMCDGDCKANPYAGILPGTFFCFFFVFYSAVTSITDSIQVYNCGRFVVLIVSFVVLFEYAQLLMLSIFIAGVQFGSKSWLPDTSRCEWYGVGCIDNETVVAVRGNSNFLCCCIDFHTILHFRAYCIFLFFPFPKKRL